MPNTPHQFQATAATFQTAVIDKSLTTPILLDFYATWCGPCKTLGPILEKLANNYHGAFELAKIDVDQERDLAASFRIRSVPTVCLVKNGQVVDGFPGAMPEGALKEFLLKHGIKPLEAKEPPQPSGPPDPVTAIKQLRQRIAQSSANDKEPLKLDLALALLQTQQWDEAQTLVEALPSQLATDPRAVRAQALLRIHQQQRNLTSRKTLEAKASSPDDHQTALQLGIHDLHEGHYSAALERLIHILQNDRDFDNGRVRSLILDAFNIIDDAELVQRYRRQLSAIIF